jgi:hypothetical protein
MLLQQHSMGVLNNLVTMDESAVSFFTPETKQQSKQWVKKDTSVADPDRFGPDPDPDPTSENRPDPDPDSDPDSSK